jgi:sugar-specific transcriptional regulator TrmB
MDKHAVELKSAETDNLRRYLEHLGLTNDQSELYIYLHILGPSTVLTLSKALSTGRTRLYPILESLHARGLIHINERHYGTTYEALPGQSLEYLVHDEEVRAQQLRQQLNDAQHAISSLSGAVTKGSRVVEYKGVDGLKQINFNLTKAHKECRVFEGAHLDEYSTMPKSFVDRIRRSFVENNIVNLDLTNSKDWKWANNPYDPEHKLQRACYIDKDVFEISVETYIYNDCIAYLQYEEDEIFGVEIYNQALASQQKMLFDLVWSQGKELAT